MTIQQAITKAMKLFNRKMPYDSIRRISLSGGTGNFRIAKGDLTSALIHIEYVTCTNDYTESDERPCYIRVDEDGKAFIV